MKPAFKVGDRVYYVLLRSLRDGRMKDLRFPATVTRTTKNRVTVKLDQSARGVRNTIASNLEPMESEVPPADQEIR